MSAAHIHWDTPLFCCQLYYSNQPSLQHLWVTFKDFCNHAQLHWLPMVPTHCIIWGTRGKYDTKSMKRAVFGSNIQWEYLPSISTQKSCICFGLIISEAKPQKTCHMHFNRDGSFYLCQYALDIKDTILDKITICYVNGSQIPRVKLLCVFCFIYSPLAPFSLLFWFMFWESLFSIQ